MATNDLLRRQRELRGWSQGRLADALAELGGSPDPKLIGKWERGEVKPSPFYRERICLVFNCRADELGLIPSSPPVPLQKTDESVELGDIMTKFDPSRRRLFEATFAVSALASLSGSLRNEQTLAHFETLNDVSWSLSNTNQLDLAEQLLNVYLPKVSSLAQQSSPFQQQAASLAARGYILAAEVDRENVAAMQLYAQQGVFYSSLTSDTQIQCDALRQEATIALIAKQPFKALLSYQKALPLLEGVSPLLKSRMYLGLASAYARCNPILYRQEALRYLGLANEHFPAIPEDDTWYLYMHSTGSRSVLHLYEALTYDDLRQPKDSWKALMQVDGLQPKMVVTDSSRLEFLNLQAKTSASLGEMERASTYLESSVHAADATGYMVWREEAGEVYQEMCQIWPNELQIRRLGKLFTKTA